MQKVLLPLRKRFLFIFRVLILYSPKLPEQSQGLLSETFMSTLAGGAKDEMIKLNLCSDSAIEVRISDYCIISSQNTI